MTTILRIGFIEMLGGIGDLLMALPAMRALAYSHRGARLSVLTFAPCDELLQGDPQVAEVVAVPRNEKPTDGEDTLRLSVKDFLDRRPYDLMVTDSCHSGIDQMVEQCSAPIRVSRLWKGTRVDEPVALTLLRNLAELGLIDQRLRWLPSWLYLSPDERAWAAGWWRQRGHAPHATVLLNPDCGMPIKRWPEQHFVEVGQELVARGWKIGVVDTTEPDVTDGIAVQIPGAFVLPRLPLRQFAAICAGTALCISADTGPARIAGAVGVPVVGIFGPTVASRYGIRGKGANLMSPFECPERRPLDFTLQACWYSGQCVIPGKRTCCEDITAQDVLNAASGLLARCHHGCPAASDYGIRREEPGASGEVRQVA